MSIYMYYHYDEVFEFEKIVAMDIVYPKGYFLLD